MGAQRVSGAPTTSRLSSMEANTRHPSPSSRAMCLGRLSGWRTLSRLWQRSWASPLTPVSKSTTMRTAAHQAKRDLDHGTVLVCWWSYVVQFCAWLGPHCDNFSGNDSVLVVEIKDGKVTSMTLDAEGFVDPGFEDEMSEEFENAGAIV